MRQSHITLYLTCTNFLPTEFYAMEVEVLLKALQDVDLEYMERLQHLDVKLHKSQHETKGVIKYLQEVKHGEESKVIEKGELCTFA